MLKNKRNFKFRTREKSQSSRQLKVSQEIHVAVAECFQKSGKLDPRLENCYLNITKVNVSPDLKVANCFYLPFNNSVDGEMIDDALKCSRFAIREYVTKKINLKYSPEVRFFFDSAYEECAMLERLKLEDEDTK